MAIEETFEGGPSLSVPRPVYRVVGDPKWLRTFPTREAAEEREVELSSVVEVISFGYLHAPAPSVDLVVDVRPFRDPHVSPELRHMTANDEPVRRTVLATPGVRELVRESAGRASALATGSGRAVTIAVGCAGGRHRAPTVAREIAARLRDAGCTVTVQHRDLDKPVVQR